MQRMKVQMLKPKDLYFEDEVVEFPIGFARKLIEEGVAVPARDVCPECGAGTVPDGGCRTCLECGWSKCG